MAAWGGVDRVLSTEKAHRQLDDHELGDGDVHRRVVERRRGDDDRNSVCARGHVGREDGAGVPEGPAPRADAVQVGLEGGERRRGRGTPSTETATSETRPLLLVEAELLNFVLREAPAGLPRSPWTPEGPLPEGLGKSALAELARHGGPQNFLGPKLTKPLCFSQRCCRTETRRGGWRDRRACVKINQ